MLLFFVLNCYALKTIFHLGSMGARQIFKNRLHREILIPSFFFLQRETRVSRLSSTPGRSLRGRNGVRHEY
jgi:hypothetical protein